MEDAWMDDASCSRARAISLMRTSISSASLVVDENSIFKVQLRRKNFL
jgi:hypothetical protein